jgi:hypothetical protein
MPSVIAGSRSRLLPISLVLAACLNACLLDPQASRSSQAASEEPHSASSGPVLAFRAALPEDAAGKVDSAELRMRAPGGKRRSWMLGVSDSILEADLSGLDAGPAQFEVLAFASGKLIYYGSLALDPSQPGSAVVVVALGRVGRVRVDALISGGME